ncbi:hypothetical protein CDL15_Pgr023055 [Punica granatum]|uniref:Uncharacterized protein n=1 Tax=Punica granatum TaxID=22663 RepID=A0A218X3X9_PUNGR|nr:hypothetical protein CDL15_Pgr023055 [Punica granatum]
MERNGSTQIDPGLQPDSIVGHTGAAVTPIRLEVVVPALNKQERTRNLCRETSTTFVGSAWTVDQFRKLAHASGAQMLGSAGAPSMVTKNQSIIDKVSRKRAFIIGVSYDYNDQFSKLYGTINDANHIGNLLINDLSFPPSSIRLLTGGANGNVRTIGWIVGPDLVLVQQLVVERLFAYPLAATSNWLLKMYMRKLLFTKFLLIDDL